MINVFKPGGAWKHKKGFSYTVKSINQKLKEQYLADGWFLNVEDVDCIDSVCEEVKPKKVSKKKVK